MKILIAILLSLNLQLFAGESADEFALTTVKDKNLTVKGTKEGLLISQYKGKIVFLEFWGKSCGPCLMSIPHYVHLQEKYKNDIKIVAIEASRGTKKGLRKYVDNPSKEIDMKHISYFLDKKTKNKKQKDSLTPAINELKEFIKSNKKINYDVVASADSDGLIHYVMQRAGWKGFIPFLLILDRSGKVLEMVSGMASNEKLEGIIKKAIGKE